MLRVIEDIYDVFDSYELSIEDTGTISNFIKTATDNALRRKRLREEVGIKPSIWKKKSDKSKKPTIRYMAGK